MARTKLEFPARNVPMLPASGTFGRSRRGSGLPMPVPGVNLAPKSRSSGGCRYKRGNHATRSLSIGGFSLALTSGARFSRRSNSTTLRRKSRPPCLCTPVQTSRSRGCHPILRVTALGRMVEGDEAPEPVELRGCSSSARPRTGMTQKINRVLMKLDLCSVTMASEQLLVRFGLLRGDHRSDRKGA